MKLEFLGRIGYRAGQSLDGFLISLNQDIENLTKCNKKIVIVGTGDNCFFAEKLLEEKGIKIHAYADNLSRVQGSILRGRKIYSLYDLFKDKDVYFIIAVTNQYIKDIRLQFMIYGIKDYSIFLNTSFHDYSNDDFSIQKVLLDAINEMCLKEERVEKALPLDECGEGSKLGNINWLLNSTKWSNWIYLWDKKILDQNKNADVLEIGPGFGLMSTILLKMYPNIHLDWLLLGDKEKCLLDDTSLYSAELKKIKLKYDNRINVFYDYLERDDCSITKKYHLIILTEVFEHFVLNPVNTLRKLSDALEYGGRIVLSTPNWGPAYKYKNWKDMPLSSEVEKEQYLDMLKVGHAYQYSKEELFDIFERVGLVVEEYKISDSNNHNLLLKKKERY